MGHELDKDKPPVPRHGPPPKAGAKGSMPAVALQDLAGNQAVKRLMEGNIPALLENPELLQAFQPMLHPTGVRQLQAQPRIKPEDLQGLLTLQLPPGFDPNLDFSPATDLSSSEAHSKRDNEFIVDGNEFGLTIVHPASETRIRVVEEEHRYKPEDWTYETLYYPKETPAISYQLIAPEEDKPGEVLVAVGPGAFVEVEEPAPFEGAKEWQLDNWQPRMNGTFDVTIVEMPDNALVPLPNENIDVATLLEAGGKMHYPDNHIWRGAISHDDYVRTWATLIAGILLAAIPGIFELAEGAALAADAASLAPEAAALAPEAEEIAAVGSVNPEAEFAVEAPLEDVGAPQIQEGLAEEEGPLADSTPPAKEPEPQIDETVSEGPEQTEKPSEQVEAAQQQADKEQRLAEIKQERNQLDAKIKELNEKIRAADKRAGEAGKASDNAEGPERDRLVKKASRNADTRYRLQGERNKLNTRASKLDAEEASLTRPPSPRTWQEAEDYLRQQFGGQKQRFETNWGVRESDCFTPDRISREAKFGPQSYSKDIQSEIKKDVDLMQSGTTKSTEWHFYENPNTGAGPNGPLARALENAEIKIVKHY